MPNSTVHFIAMGTMRLRFIRPASKSCELSPYFAIASSVRAMPEASKAHSATFEGLVRKLSETAQASACSSILRIDSTSASDASRLRHDMLQRTLCHARSEHIYAGLLTNSTAGNVRSGCRWSCAVHAPRFDFATDAISVSSESSLSQPAALTITDCGGDLPSIGPWRLDYPINAAGSAIPLGWSGGIADLRRSSR